MTFHCEKQPLRGAFQSLFAGSAVELSTTPNVPDVPITLKVQEVPLRLTFYQAIRQVTEKVPNLLVDGLGKLDIIPEAKAASDERLSTMH